ncbi:glycosyltransferase [Staphylococcus gallinarum]|uniref:Glycosyltransferase n=6 Tax=Staphylococcus TaxID=1279 RepID=A0A418HL99_STAGA|nr:glycosyltransferase family 4 protein [Staphylococcus gallinarum]MCD8827191.1 glycosyltransferase family 4 protein [Staphylococcus gallinarum]RIL41382.1 glycosyltransferase [Staphylococcus gallinarum]
MNILHINSNYLHSPLYSEMIKKLENINVTNDVIMPRKINDNQHVKNNLTINNAKIYNSQFLTNMDRFLYFHKQNKIQKWILNENIKFDSYDLIHAHTLFSDGYQALKLHKPYVVTVRNTDVNYYLKYFKHLKPTAKKIINNAKKLIFLSESYKEKTLQTIFKQGEERNKNLEKSIVIPNGINDFWINNINNKNKQITDEINVLFVGRVMKNKNIKFLAENINEVNLNSKVNIYIVGEIIEESYYNELKKYENLKFLGKKTKEEIIQLMQDMHIFTLISHHETFGLVYLEAISQNLPVLYTKGEGFDNYFMDGEVGYAVDINSNEDLIEKTNKIIKQYDEFQNRLSTINKQDFSWEMNAYKHKTIYESLINKESNIQ